MYLERSKAQFYTVKGAHKFQSSVQVYTSCTPPYDCMGYIQ